MEFDIVQRFMFEDSPVRGEYVRLEGNLQRIIAQHKYPFAVADLLSEVIVASVLIGATMKFQGTLTVQYQGGGPLSLLVAQYTHDHKIRAVARFDEEALSEAILNSFEKGELVITVMQQQGKPYQSIVPIQGNTIAEAIESFFTQSEQVPTKTWIKQNDGVAVGFMLQEMPDVKKQKPTDDWDVLSMFAETIDEKELFEHDLSGLLHRLYHDRDIRLFEPDRVQFACRCNKERMENAVRVMGLKEAREILSTHKKVEVTCDFCNNQYEFNDAEVEKIFKN